MHITSSVMMNKKDFNLFKEQVRAQSSFMLNDLNSRPESYSPRLREIGLGLTKRCNLKCKYCWDWSDNGKYKDQIENTNNDELDVSVIEKVLVETEPFNSSLMIVGGEPLMHRSWECVAELLTKYPRSINLSTNGLLIKDNIKSILMISDNLTLVISLPGFNDSLEAIRGLGAYDHLFKNIKYILSLKKKGIFKGSIEINCVLNEQVVARLYEFTCFVEKLGVDYLFYSYPYYISEETSDQADKYFSKNFSWLKPNSCKSLGWHYYKYSLDSKCSKILKSQIELILEKRWNIRVRFHPNLELSEIDGFINGEVKKLNNKSVHCINAYDRLEVFSDGTVSACHIFPDFVVGNVYEEGIMDIWNGENMKRARKIINYSFSNSTFPVGICSKCNLISDSQL